MPFCPVECLPNEMRYLFHLCGTYSSGIAPAAGTGDCPVKFCKNSAANTTEPVNPACPVKFLSSENHVNERRSLFHQDFEDKERSLTRETYLSFLFNQGEFNWGTSEPCLPR